uniref:N-acetyltransferase n=1 Tax=candidate division WOR-3 bacterium TaxID=2052148 RepID=A0A7C4UGQ3_UNCW3
MYYYNCPFLDEEEFKIVETYRKKGYKIKCFSQNDEYLVAFIRDFKGKKIGGIGFLRNSPLDEKDFYVILDKAEEWFKKNHINKYYIPINFNTWYSYRIMSKYFQNRFFEGEMNYSRRYNKYFKKAGMKVAQRYYSFIVRNPKKVFEYTYPAFRKIENEGIKIEEIEINEENLKKVYDISCVAFNDAFLFEPIPFEEFLENFYLSIKDKFLTIYRTIFLASVEGKPAGFIYGYGIDDKYAYIAKTLAVHPEFRHLFIGLALIYKLYEKGKEYGYDAFIHAFVRESGSTYLFSRKFGKIHRIYSLYEKDIRKIF